MAGKRSILVVAAAITAAADGVIGGAARFGDASSKILIGTAGLDAGSEWTASSWVKDIIDTSNWNALFHNGIPVATSARLQVVLQIHGSCDKGSDILP